MSNIGSANSEENSYTPPNPVLLLFKVKKSLQETEGAKYLQIRVFKKYKIVSHLKFEDGQTTNNFEQTKDHPLWYVVKLYLPLNSDTRIIDKAYGKLDRVGIMIPKKAIIEIETPKLEGAIKDQFVEYSKNMAKFHFKFNHTKDGQFFFLTNKNWMVVSNEPGAESFELTLD